jgi:hypothetical protein
LNPAWGRWTGGGHGRVDFRAPKDIVLSGYAGISSESLSLYLPALTISSASHTAKRHASVRNTLPLSVTCPFTGQLMNEVYQRKIMKEWIRDVILENKMVYSRPKVEEIQRFNVHENQIILNG